jgi:hypothetical protein
MQKKNKEERIMKLVKKLINFIVIIFLSLSILSSFLVFTVSNTILNKEYILNKMEECNYYEKTYLDINDILEQYIGPSGLDEEVLKDIYTEEQVKNDIDITVNAIFTGEEKTIETETIREKLSKNIYENYTITNSQKEAINNFEDTIINEYTKQITHHDYLYVLENYNPTINKIMAKLKIIMPIIVCIIIVCLIILNIKNTTKIIQGILIGFLSAGLTIMVIGIIINLNINFEAILILNEIFSDLIRNIANELLKTFQNIGIVIAILSTILLIVTNTTGAIKRNKKQMKQSSKK